jgi:Holliday junction resolvase RusA-like endonuclease
MAGRELRFTVVGEPIPQGSMKSFVVRRKRDGKAIAVTTGDNPKTKGWRQTVAHCAALELQRAEHRGLFFEGSVEFDVTFYLPRPKALLTRSKAGQAVAHTKKPDVGKLARAAEDALSRVVWGDDAQITDLIARKRYCAVGAHPRIDIIVRDGPFPAESADRREAPSLFDPAAADGRPHAR